MPDIFAQSHDWLYFLVGGLALFSLKRPEHEQWPSSYMILKAMSRAYRWRGYMWSCTHNMFYKQHSKSM